ncbi:MAG: hypothetical protein IIZ93_09080 [Acidaminococcaceae bacterium]|nr:hypothetical protein [Acidaminococcaceae bacterium]
MELKNIFKMVKANRYTQDGRDELAKLQETEDVKYKTGDISQKTGLQKQPDGSWAPPKETKYGKVQQNKEGKWGVQQKLGKGSQFLEHKNEKDASKALANYTAGYNTTERSKQDPHSNEARQAKQWNKETEKIAKENKAERRAEHAAQFQSKPAEVKAGSVMNNAKEQYKAYVDKSAEYLKAYQEEQNKRPARSTPNEKEDILASLVQNTNKQKEMYLAIDDMNRGTGGWEINKQTAKKITELQKEQKALEAKLKKTEGNKPTTQEESKPAEKDIRSEFNITREEHDMDARESNAKIYPELQPLVKQRKAFFQKQVEAYTKLRDNPNNPKARADFVDAKNAISQIDADIDRAYKKATGDAAPRQLTGDCKIRIKK